MKTIKIKSIEYAGKSDVYNMEVKDFHNYSVMGLIIHNCLDALRYLIMSKPRYDIEEDNFDVNKNNAVWYK